MCLRNAWFVRHRGVHPCIRRAFFAHPLRTSNRHFKNGPEVRSIAQKPNVSTGRAKIYREHENEHFHKVMEDIPAYLNTVIPSPSRGNLESLLSAVSDQIQSLCEFQQLSLHSQGVLFDIENAVHTNLVQDIAQNLGKVSDDGLKNCLLCLCLWPETPGTRTPNFKLLWTSLDLECSSRCPSWTEDRQLSVADCFFHLRLSRITSYNRTMLRILAKSLHVLSIQNIVQYLFYSNLQRRMVASIENILQARVYESLSQLTVEELGVVCQGFFKCQKKITSKDLLHGILAETVQKLPDVSSPTLCAVIKAIRYSSTTSEVLSCQKILAACEEHMGCWDTPSSIQVSGLAVQLKVYRPALLDAISRHILSKLNTVRLKDITKVLYALAMFCHDDGSFCTEVVKELRNPNRAEEIAQYHYCLVSCVWYLALLRGTFYDDLTAAALDESKIDFDGRHKDVTFELAAVHHSVQIECPTYEGPLLSPNTLERCLHAQNSNKMAGLTMQERLTLEVRDNLERAYGKGPRIVHVLRHFHSPDIVFDVDPKDNRICEPSLRTVADGIMAAEVVGGHTAAIVVLGPGAFCYDSDRLNGLTRAKIRQLGLLGFRVIPVPYKRVHLFSKPNTYVERLLF